MSDTSGTENLLMVENKTADQMFNEAAVEAALNNAGPLAQKRFIAKTSKIKWRAGKWLPNRTELKHGLSIKTGGYIEKQRLPCADLNQYIYNFILTFAPEHVTKGTVYAQT